MASKVASKGRWGTKKTAKEAPRVLPVRRKDFDVPEAVCVLFENYFTIEECDRYMSALRDEIDWMKQQVAVGRRDGDQMKEVEEPRLTMFMSDPGICYEYSGRENVGVGWHPIVLAIKRKAEQAVVESGLEPVVFNSVQMNRYEGPRHTLGMHADDEEDLEKEAPIASVSFGATRDFKIMAKEDNTKVWFVPLADGAFFVMGGKMQQKYLHGIPPGTDPGLRINLTFRRCIPRESVQQRLAPGVGRRRLEVAPTQALAGDVPVTGWDDDLPDAEPQPSHSSGRGRPPRGAAAAQQAESELLASHGSAAPGRGAQGGFYAEEALRAMHSHGGSGERGKGKGKGKGSNSEPTPASRGKGYNSVEESLLGRCASRAGKGKAAIWGVKG